jgi:uncharacterized OB-fold protein
MAERPAAPAPSGEAARPVPQPSPSLAPFYEAAAAGALLLAHCATCDRYELPGAHTCPVCLRRLGWREACGRGSVFTFVVFHRALHPAFEVPYAVCVIELEEGPRMVGVLAEVRAEQVVIGMPVTAVFETGASASVPLRWRAEPPAPHDN